MRMDANLPRIGLSAATLGVRLGKDIAALADGMVHPGTGGMSVTPTSASLLPSWVASELRTGRLTVFTIRPRDLGPDLNFRRDPDNPEAHGFVEPIRPRTFDDYQRAVWNTRERWRPI